MIYQLKITMKQVHPPIWARLQVTSDSTFEDLNDYLQDVFDYEEDQPHIFEMPENPDNQRGLAGEIQRFLPITVQIVSSIDSWDTATDKELLEEEDFILENFLCNSGDKGTYQFGSDVYEILLEKRIHSDQGNFPKCVKISQGFFNYLNEKIRKDDREAVLFADPSEVVDEMNDLFELYNEELFDLTENADDWRILIDFASRYRELAPWKWLDSDQVIALDLPGYTDRAYCFILGADNMLFGLAVYLGKTGLARVNETYETINEEEMPEIYRRNRGLNLSFTGQEDMSPEEWLLFEELGLYPDEGEWPMFRSFTPGMAPCFLKQNEIRQMSAILEQITDVAVQTKKSPRSIPHYQDEQWFLRSFHDTSETKLDTLFTPDRETEIRKYSTDVPLGDLGFSLKQLKKSSPVLNVWAEVGVRYAPVPVKSENDPCPYYPKIYLMVDHQNGQIMKFALVPPEKEIDKEAYARFIRLSFLELIQELGRRPSGILIDSSDMRHILQPVCKILGIFCNESTNLRGLSAMLLAMEDEMGNLP
ncbi:hypothetical protein ABNN70_07850 [Sporolactobacillus sp. Y61]|uniref:Uncharacterized protein n=1 Tax=Sporolactobacillus sp. Y61 TaxID=3160863 RepID=A0AAU8IBN5_9BACL